MSSSLGRHGHPPHDLRVYVCEPGFLPAVNIEDARLFCHAHEESSEAFHRIAIGELYLNQGIENYCLNCSYRRGLLTLERPSLEHAAFKAL